MRPQLIHELFGFHPGTEITHPDLIIRLDIADIAAHQRISGFEAALGFIGLATVGSGKDLNPETLRSDKRPMGAFPVQLDPFSDQAIDLRIPDHRYSTRRLPKRIRG